MYALAPNSSVIMLDEYEAAIWVKMTDGAGYPTLTKYRIEECKPEHATDFKSLEDRIKKLEEVIYESDHTENEHI